MKSYAQTGGSQHGQVVDTVAYGNCLLYIDILHLRYDTQQLGLTLAIDNVAQITAGELAVAYLQIIGINIVETKALLEIIAEVSEAARKYGSLVAGTFQYLDRKSVV